MLTLFPPSILALLKSNEYHSILTLKYSLILYSKCVFSFVSNLTTKHLNTIFKHYKLNYHSHRNQTLPCDDTYNLNTWKLCQNALLQKILVCGNLWERNTIQKKAWEQVINYWHSYIDKYISVSAFIKLSQGCQTGK